MRACESPFTMPGSRLTAASISIPQASCIRAELQVGPAPVSKTSRDLVEGAK